MKYSINIIFKDNTSVDTKFSSLTEAIEYLKNYDITLNDIYYKNPIKKINIEEVN